MHGLVANRVTSAKSPILVVDKVLEGLAADMQLKEYVISPVEMEDNKGYLIYARSEEQAIRVAINGLGLEGELHSYSNVDWDTLMHRFGRLGQLKPEPHIYNGRIDLTEGEE